jgi:membrane-associated PAP2 superfamily phosphatase
MLKELAAAVNKNEIICVTIRTNSFTLVSKSEIVWSFYYISDSNYYMLEMLESILGDENAADYISAEVYTNWLRTAHKYATSLYNTNLKNTKPS